VTATIPETRNAKVASTLRTLFDAQRTAFAGGAPDYERRMKALGDLRAAVRARQAELQRAVSDDFGGRAHDETLMLELFPFYDQVRHARRHLKGWMRRKPVASSWFLQPSDASNQYQPLGVAGVIGAWNYQLLLTLGPVVDALAAGNHVLLKPSEITPRSAELIATIISETFPADYVACVTGGPEVASAFTSLPFDHLFFTGSTRVGRLVMQAAAANLTPVTLELGGKSPAIVHGSFSLPLAADRIMAGKLFNAGQTCVAPDYLLLPEGREAAFEAEARRAVGALYPGLPGNPEYTRIVSAQHHERLSALIDDARGKGARVVTLGMDGSANGASRKGGRGGDAGGSDRIIPPTLVFGADDSMALMQEEIFGPIMPIITWRTLDEAIAFVNARPRPLALYYFDDSADRRDVVLQRTMSGGVTFNDCVFHLGQHNLPFGGVGPSGMGHYHGFDGFATFSKKRAVMVQHRWAATAWAGAPWSRRRRLLDVLVRLGMR
jgi:coniferyl-aldehyde dehydrogenase